MIKIIEQRAALIPVISSKSACDSDLQIRLFAEIKIEEDGKILYIHVRKRPETVYTVGENSIYNYMMTKKTCKFEECYFLEDYIDYNDAMTSKYAEYFKMADEMLENYRR